MKLKGHSLTSKCDEIMTLQEMIVISFKSSAQILEIKTHLCITKSVLKSTSQIFLFTAYWGLQLLEL